METSARFSLPKATTGHWLGLNPWMRPLPIPCFVTLAFPPGDYEIAFDGQEAKWRYLGPHFSTKGTYVNHTNPDGSGYATPVGFKGEYCFAGGWVPSGFAIGAVVPSLVAEQQSMYAQMLDALKRNNTGRLLAVMIKRRGL